MSNHRIFSGTWKLATGTFASRILGFIREILAAKYVGGGHEMDVFATAYRIPNLLRQILGEKACESAFLPVYKTLHAQDKKDDAENLSGDLFKILILILTVAFGAFLLWAPALVRLMGDGFLGIGMKDGSDKFSSAVLMTRQLLPLILFTGIFSFLGARMLAQERFGMYAAAPILANIVVIAVIIFAYPKIGWVCLGWGVMAGGLAEALFFFLGSGNRKNLLGKNIFSFSSGKPAIKKAASLWIPITVGSALEKVGTIVETRMASFLGKGAVAGLYFGNLVNLLFFSVLGLSFNRSVIPKLTEQNARNNHREFRNILFMGIRVNLILLLPVSVFLILLSKPVIALFLQRGNFDSEATARAALALVFYSIGLVAQGWMNLFSRAFYAHLDTRTPLMVSFFSLGVNIALNFLLWKTPLRHGGLALASSIGTWVNAIALFILLNRRMKSVGESFGMREIADLLWRSAAPCLALGFGLYWIWPMLESLFPFPGFSGLLLRLSLATMSGGILFIAVASFCGIPEVRKIIRKAVPAGSLPKA